MFSEIQSNSDKFDIKYGAEEVPNPEGKEATVGQITGKEKLRKYVLESEVAI